MQFQVPQFIETEDKIVGPLTLRQFFYIGAAVGLSFILYYVIETWLWVILTALIVGFAAALGFVKIHGRPFMQILASAFSFYWNPQTYVWLPENPRAEKREEVGAGGFIDSVISGVILRDTWRALQTGSPRPRREMKQRYEIYQKLTGERQAAKRVDFR